MLSTIESTSGLRSELEWYELIIYYACWVRIRLIYYNVVCDDISYYIQTSYLVKSPAITVCQGSVCIRVQDGALNGERYRRLDIS